MAASNTPMRPAEYITARRTGRGKAFLVQKQLLLGRRLSECGK
jgi:hypothetical protein